MTLSELAAENQELRARLQAVEETVKAIQEDEVDAVVVGANGPPRVYALGGADESYRTFVEAMGVGALTAAADGAILYCNRHFAQMVGGTAPDLLGTSVYQFVAAEHEGHLRALIWEGMGAGVTRELPLQSRAGQPFLASITVTPLKVAGVTSVCILVHDLTEREARLAAEVTSAAKDRFLALLSHELRTPLTPILMALDEIELGNNLSHDVQQDFAMIRRNLQLQVRLIDDLLDLSRVSTGKLRLQKEPLSIHRLIKNIHEMLRHDMTEKRVRLTHKLAAEHDQVNGDAARLQQVLWNILKNAIKFSDEGKAIDVSTFNPEPGIVQIDIRDQGVGIDASLLPRIFDAFQQGDLDTSQRQRGLGLGLAIARSMVEAHGGRISAHSQGLGHGSTFCICLPVISQVPA